MRTKDYYEKVIVLNCGGTIDMDKNRTLGSSSVGKVLPDVQELLRHFNIEFEYENVFNNSPDSTNIGIEQWDLILNKVKEIIKYKKAVKDKLVHDEMYPVSLDVGGIVISHGTDTLQLTSLMLALRLSLDGLFFPIIFTGSFTTIDDESNDIANNLAKSIYSAKPVNTCSANNKLPPQVYALIGNEIHLATRTTKVYTTQNSEGKYFFSYPFPVARITSNTPIKSLIKKKESNPENWKTILDNTRITINFDSEYFNKLTTSNSTSSWKYAKEFLVEKFNWPIVEHIVINKSLTKEVLLDLLERIRHEQRNNENQRYGVVIQGNFSNRQDFDEIKNAILTIASTSTIILVGSKDVYKRLSDINNIGLIHKSLSYQKARTKLSFLLKLNLQNKELIEFMNENIMGEIAEYEKFPDWIQYENFVEDAEVVPVYPNIKNIVYEHAIMRSLKNTNGKNGIFLYCFGNGHIPTINIPISEAVSVFLNDNSVITLQTLCKIPDSNDLDIILQNVEKIIIDNPQEIKEYILKHYDFEPYKHNSGHITELSDFIIKQPNQIAKRLIKDSLMHSSKTLRLLGEAIDKNITINVKTSAQAKTNHSQYPVGRVLLAIGIDSDEVNGWATKNLRREKNTLPNILYK